MFCEVMQNQSPINHETQFPTNQISNDEIKEKKHIFKKREKHYCNE
jgi:hypothetical protein